MLINPHDLRLGALIFVGGHTLTSFLIRKFTKFKYSHVGVYVGMGTILEADWGGVVKNPIHKYLNTNEYYGEVLPVPLSDKELATFLSALLEKYNQDYDFMVNIGSIVSLILHRPRTMPALFNRAKAWRCTEIVAYGLRKAGQSLKIPDAQVWPKDLYTKYKKEADNNGQ